MRLTILCLFAALAGAISIHGPDERVSPKMPASHMMDKRVAAGARTCDTLTCSHLKREYRQLLAANTKCAQDPKYRTMDSRTALGRAVTLEECTDLCASTEECEEFAFGRADGHYGGVCLGCRAGSPQVSDGGQGFDYYRNKKETSSIVVQHQCRSDAQVAAAIALDPFGSWGNGFAHVKSTAEIAERHCNENVCLDGHYCGIDSTGACRCVEQQIKSPVAQTRADYTVYREHSSCSTKQDEGRLFRSPATGNPTGKVTAQDCFEMCDMTAGCAHFVLGVDPAHRGVCIGCTSNAVLTSHEGMRMYQMPVNFNAAGENKKCSEGGTRLFRDPENYAVMSHSSRRVRECALRCRNTEGCEHFSLGGPKSDAPGVCIGCKRSDASTSHWSTHKGFFAFDLAPLTHGEAPARPLQEAKPVDEVPTVTDHKVTVPMELSGFTVAAFSAAVQTAVRIATADAIGVHRNDVALLNIRAAGASRRRLLESAAAAAVAFDTEINVFEPTKVPVVRQRAKAIFEAPRVAADFAETFKGNLGAAASSATAQVHLAASAEPKMTSTTVKTGCYVKTHSCPNRTWATGTWNWHERGTREGKAYCLGDAENHHKSCGGDVMDAWSQKWVDNTGETVETYPKPGCYWKLESCPNHPEWLTTPAHGGSASSWKRHHITDQKTCVGSAWSHHSLCGLHEGQLSSTVFIGDENSADARKASKHTVSCGVQPNTQIIPVAATLSTSFGTRNGAEFCIDGDTSHDGGAPHGNTCISNKVGAVTDGQWLRIDLGANYHIDNVQIYNRLDCCQARLGAHVVETSEDDTNWSTCFTGTLPSSAGPFTEACSAFGRYVRLRQTGHNDYINLREVQVFGKPACARVGASPGSQVTAGNHDASHLPERRECAANTAVAKLTPTGATLTQALSGSKHAAANCIDGVTSDANNYCHSSKNDATNALEIDLGEDRLLDHVKIYNRAANAVVAGRLAYHVIETKAAGSSTWYQCNSQDANSEAVLTERCVSLARYVRVRLVNHVNFLNLQEVEVYGFPTRCNSIRGQYVLGNTGTWDTPGSGWGCPSGSSEVLNPAECIVAGRAVVGPAATAALQNPMQTNDFWRNPTGCGYHAGAHFSFSQQRGNEGSWPKVCKLDTAVASAMSSGFGTAMCRNPTLIFSQPNAVYRTVAQWRAGFSTQADGAYSALGKLASSAADYQVKTRPATFKYDGTKRNYADSIRYCQSQGMVIASIHSDAENAEVKALIPSGTTVYLGATQTSTAGVFEWHDGSAWDYMPAGTPADALTNPVETHLAIGAHDGNWQDWQWGTAELAVICRSLPRTTFTVDFTARTYGESVQYCQSQGMEIASIHNDVENDAVTALANSQTVYLGALETSTEGVYRWHDGTKWDYTPADTPENALNTAAESRIVIAAHNQKWDDWGTGSSKLGVVCQSVPKFSFVMQWGDGTEQSWRQTSNPMVPNPASELFHVSDTKRNYADSVQYCQDQGMVIASIHDDTENELAKALLSQSTYLGATKTSSTDTAWTWADGSPFNYAGAGAIHQGETRLAIHNGEWHDWGTGSNKLAVLCRKPACDSHCGTSGYEAISAVSNGCNWRGLEYGGRNTALDGSVDSGEWWSAVGTKKSFDGDTMPGPCGQNKAALKLYTCS